MISFFQKNTIDIILKLKIIKLAEKNNNKNVYTCNNFSNIIYLNFWNRQNETYDIILLFIAFVQNSINKCVLNNLQLTHIIQIDIKFTYIIFQIIDFAIVVLILSRIQRLIK